ncbi:MAG: ABC transporter permease subunit, partial [Polaromonas sp.]|nr:ABC transporter permease subunit [Polaromonas sp.]
MTEQVRELQVTPLPDAVDAPGLGFLPLGNVGPSQAAVFLRDVGRRLLPWVVPVGLIALWQIASSLGWLSTRVLPAPSEVLKAAWTLAVSGELWTHVKVSAGRALAGLAIGGGLGLVFGLLTGSVRFFETLLDSTIQMVRNIPALALIPLVILWFGIDETAKLFLIAVSVFFPIYINTFHGIRNVDPGLIEMGRTYGLSRWQLYREVILPGALSSILVGL